MLRTYAVGVAVLAAATIAACGGGSESSSDKLGKAFCSDLVAGASVYQIIASAPDEFEGTVDAAVKISLWVEEHCPAQLRSHEGLRGFIDANGFDPDDLDG